MKVEVAAKMVREEEKEKEEEVVAPAWGVIKNKGASDQKDDKRYPSLAKSVASSAIHLEDKSGQVNIATSKNIFASLENDDDEEDGPKRPQNIKPALVPKKKGCEKQVCGQKEIAKEEQNFADLQIQPDHEAVRSKYVGRKKFKKKPLPPEELEEEKENKPQRPAAKKKWAQMDEEEEEMKYVEKFEVDEDDD
eukprot:Skav213661  [mRNA]  locus=scaffold2012:469062:469861:- [translate_table: standard]